MELFKNWWFWLIVVIMLIFLYLVLSKLGIIPHYCCGSTMGENGPVNWCGWYKGPGCPVG